MFVFALLLTLLSLAKSKCEGDRTRACLEKSLMGPQPWKKAEGLTTVVNGKTVSYNSGVTFRVWAPHASSVVVKPYSPNGRWSQTQMTSESNGTWYANVGNAQPGDSYVYQLQSPSGTIIRLDPRAQDIDPTKPLGGWSYSVVHDPEFDWGSSSFAPPSPNEIVIYELHIPTFNVEGDVGTFDSAIKKLPFLQNLGVNAVELMPIAAYSGGPTGWGYNPCAPYAVLPQLGGYKGLKRFVKAANDLGMGVFLDVVWNHASGDNILNLYDGYKGNTGLGIYFYDDGRAETPWGPRFNYDAAPVSDYIIDNTAMWMDEYHITGFRWDSTVCIRKGGDGKVCWESGENIDGGWKVMQRANDLVTKAGGFTSAEDSQGWDDITKPQSDRSAGLPGAPGGAGFTSQWGYPFYYDFTLDQLIVEDNSQVDMTKVAAAIVNQNNAAGDPHRVMFTENHDMASNQNHGRIPEIINPGGNPYKPTYWAAKKAMLGVGVILTSPVFPMLFYGQELLSYATFDFPSPPPIDWNLESANSGFVQEVTDLVALRLNKGGVTKGLTGNITTVLTLSDDTNDKVVAFLRSVNKPGSPGDVLVILNMYETDYPNFQVKNVPRDGTWKIRFNGDLKRYFHLFDDFGSSQTQMKVSGGTGFVQLPKYSLLILSQ